MRVRANGAVYGPLAILFVALFPARFGLMFALLPTYGADAIWWAQSVGSVACAILAAAYYRWGAWRAGGLMSVAALTTKPALSRASGDITSDLGTTR